MIGTYLGLAFLLLVDVLIVRLLWHGDGSSNYRIDDDELD